MKMAMTMPAAAMTRDEGPALFKGIQAGEPAALRTLMARRDRWVRGIILAVTGDPDLPCPDMSGFVRSGLVMSSALFPLQAERRRGISRAGSGSSRCVLPATRRMNASRSACS